MSDSEFADINVMAVEDEAFSQQVVSAALEKLGVASVSIADNGADAIAKLSNADPKIDLIICDIEMPEMPGFELVRKLRYGIVPAYKDVSIVMLTGKDTDRNAQSARIHRIDGFLVKPVTVERLRAVIRHALDK